MIRQLDTPILASKIRFVPWSVHPRTVCMRVELYGCPYTGQLWSAFSFHKSKWFIDNYVLDSLLSYSIPQGFKTSGLDLRDSSYDGVTKEGHLRSGLGRLTDGILGRDSFRFSAQDWVGWRNSSKGKFILDVSHFSLHPCIYGLILTGATLAMEFAFTEVRNVSAMWLHCNNQFREGVKVFSSAKLKFSLDSKTFSKVPVDYLYTEDSVIGEPRFIS